MHLFFFNDTATTEIYTLSLHDALPIFRPAAGRPRRAPGGRGQPGRAVPEVPRRPGAVRTGGRADAVGRDRVDPLPAQPDRKSTRLNSSHANISYAVFCLKKKRQRYISV